MIFYFGRPPVLWWRRCLHRFLNGRCTGISCTARWANLTTPSAPTRLVHHQTFKADHTYHLDQRRGQENHPHGLVERPRADRGGDDSVVAASCLTGAWGIACGVADCVHARITAPTNTCTGACICPRSANIERSGIYFRLNGHHLLHHRYMHKNFNVVFPLADLCLGTLLLRSKVHFKQADRPCRS